MSLAVRPAFTLGLIGSSLTTGRLSADWVATLQRELPLQPEAKGPIRIFNEGHGGWTSADILAAAPVFSRLRPNHILWEPGAINSCVDSGGGPAISRAQHLINCQGALAQWLANIPGVDVTVQTMSPVAASGAALRPTLADYYADEIASLAIANGLGYLDNYAAWPKPLDPTKSFGAAPWAIAATAGFGPLPDGTIWNPADKAGNVSVISADGLQVIQSGVAAGYGAIRSATPIVGKMRYEVKLGSGVGNNLSFGVGTAAASLTNFVGSSAQSCGIFIAASGSIEQGGAGVASAGFSGGPGDVIGVEVDRTNNLIFFQKGATRSAGVDISGIPGAIYPMFAGFNVGDGLTAHFTPNGDGLHPIWTGAVDTYLYPAVLAWAKAKMAAFWPG
jgi:hypothetical protein